MTGPAIAPRPASSTPQKIVALLSLISSSRCRRVTPRAVGRTSPSEDKGLFGTGVSDPANTSPPEAERADVSLSLTVVAWSANSPSPCDPRSELDGARGSEATEPSSEHTSSQSSEPTVGAAGDGLYTDPRMSSDSRIGTSSNSSSGFATSRSLGSRLGESSRARPRSVLAGLGLRTSRFRNRRLSLRRCHTTPTPLTPTSRRMERSVAGG